MINFVKSQPAPECLEKQKKNKTGTYNCDGVKEQLVKDFFDKCYICEEKDISKKVVEHFQSHRSGKDRNLMFDWNNLYLACGHCNEVKGARFDYILNCTNSEHKILDWIEYKIETVPFAEVEIISKKDDDELVRKTVELLIGVYNGTNMSNKFNSNSIRKKLILEIKKFQQLLDDYFYKSGLEEDDKVKLRMEIKRNIHPETPFTAFKIWILKRTPEIEKEFADFLI
jgi:hypothetical protein